MAETPVVLEVRGLTKRFPGVLANDHIDLKLHKGEVLGLLGENGAGKSTLMNIIYGLYSPDSGEILVNGQKMHIKDPNDAIRLGIGMVHQHFQLVPVLTVTENIMLGNESLRFKSVLPKLELSGAQMTLAVLGAGALLVVALRVLPVPVLVWVFALMLAVLVGAGVLWLATNLLNRMAARARILEIGQQYGLEVDPDALVQDLSVGVQQRVEIIKALYRKADILILDEPSAVLTPQETEGLFEIMRMLLARGVSLIFISHKLKEVLRICDNIAVLRLGRCVGNVDPKEATEEMLASMMVGREVILQVEKSPAHPGEPVLVVNNIVVNDDRDLQAVKNVSLEVRAGEILGVAGVQGNGQTELVEAITGLRQIESGLILIEGRPLANEPPRRIIETGVAHVPEDRQKNGMVASFPVKDNLVLQTYYRAPFAGGILANERAIAENAEQVVARFDVRTPSIYVNIGTLSGGNQQKVIVGREFSRQSRLLIVAQPTRGLDVGSIEFIHKQIVRMRDEGTAVLLVSTELDEILSLADRVAVMYAGHIIDTLPIEQTDRENIGLLMAGIKRDKAVANG